MDNLECADVVTQEQVSAAEAVAIKACDALQSLRSKLRAQERAEAAALNPPWQTEGVGVGPTPLPRV